MHQANVKLRSKINKLYGIKELVGKFEFLGDGICATWCNVHDDKEPEPCQSVGLYKKSPDNDECRLACENELSCSGYSILKYSERERDCFVFGNISLSNVANWSNPDDWDVTPEYVYGFVSFEVHSIIESPNWLCYKKINGELDIGKFSNLSIFANNIHLNKQVVLKFNFSS